MLKNVYGGLNARSKVYLSKVYFCKMYPTCMSSKLCEFIFKVDLFLRNMMNKIYYSGQRYEIIGDSSKFEVESIHWIPAPVGLSWTLLPPSSPALLWFHALSKLHLWQMKITLRPREHKSPALIDTWPHLDSLGFVKAFIADPPQHLFPQYHRDLTKYPRA